MGVFVTPRVENRVEENFCDTHNTLAYENV